MTFFYDLNKRLNSIRELPETTHGQLNESAAKKPDANKDGIPDYAQDGKGPNDLAKGSAKQKPDYKSKMQDKFGGSAADLTKGLSIKSKKVDEAGMSRAADLTKGLSIKSKKVDEAGMSRAAKGYEKYGKQGMQALAKAGRDGKALDPVRKKFNKYDESMAESRIPLDQLQADSDFDPENLMAGPELKQQVIEEIKMMMERAIDNGEVPVDDVYYDFGDIFNDVHVNGDNQLVDAYTLVRSIDDEDDVETFVANCKKALAMLGVSMAEGNYTKDAMELNPDFARVGQKPGVMGKIAQGVKRVADFVAPGDEDLMRDLERKSGGRRPANFADKIAGAKKEVDEMLGDVAAEAMKAALGQGKQTTMGEAVSNRYTPQDVAQAIKYKDVVGQNIWNSNNGKIRFMLRNMHKQDLNKMLSRPLATEADWAMLKKQIRDQIASQGMAEATKEIPGGRRHTSEPGGYGRRDDEDAPRVQTQRGRGRPKKGSDSETGEVMKPDFSAFGIGGKVNLPKHKGAVTKHKMVGESPDQQQVQQIYNDLAEIRAAAKQAQRGGQFPQGFASQLESVLWSAMTLIKNQQPGDAQVSEEELDEKAESKNQAIAARIAMQHKKAGTKPKAGTASAEMAKMSKADLEDFTKAKSGAPKKVKEEDTDTRDTRAEKAGKRVTKDIEYDEKAKDGDHGNKRGPQDAKAEKAGKKVAKDIEHDEKVDETTTSGSVATAPAATGKKAKGGMSFGQGIYDSWNRELENMISESATRIDESINVSVNMSNGGESGTPTKSITVSAEGDDADRLAELLLMAGMSPDHSHGTAYSQAPDMVDENKPNWPTNTEYSDDAFQYSGGLNKPKSSGQTTAPVVASQLSRQHSYTDEDEDQLSEASDSDMADRVRDLVGDFDRNMTQMRVYGDPDVDRAIAYLKQGDAESAVAAVVDTYGTQDGGEFRNMSDYAQDLLGDFESLIGSGQDDLARMMEMAGIKKKAVDEEKTEEGNLFTKGLADDDVKIGDKIPGTNAVKKKDIDESIFAMTANLWKSYNK